MLPADSPMTEPLPRRVTRRTALKAGAAVGLAGGFRPRPATAQAPKEPARPPVEAYTDRLSYAPGEEVRVHLSSAVAAVGYKVTRLGPKPLAVEEGQFTAARAHPIPTDASSHGCRWP